MTGRPRYKVTEKQREQVRRMTALGVRQDQVAAVLGVDAKTLRRHFREELDLGAVEANVQVLESLFRMATSGKNTTATIFWAKTRCGFRERTPEDGDGAAEKPSELLVRLD